MSWIEDRPTLVNKETWERLDQYLTMQHSAVLFFVTGGIEIGDAESVGDVVSAIKGSVHLYRKVKLEIDEDADVGGIIEHY